MAEHGQVKVRFIEEVNNNDSFLGHLITEGAIWTGIAINNATEVGLQQKHLYYWAKKFWHLRKV